MFSLLTNCTCGLKSSSIKIYSSSRSSKGQHGSLLVLPYSEEERWSSYKKGLQAFFPPSTCAFFDPEKPSEEIKDQIPLPCSLNSPINRTSDEKGSNELWSPLEFFENRLDNFFNVFYVSEATKKPCKLFLTHFVENLPQDEQSLVIGTLFKLMVQSALESESLFSRREALSVLYQFQTKSITLSRKEVFSLFCLFFFGLTPLRPQKAESSHSAPLALALLPISDQERSFMTAKMNFVFGYIKTFSKMAEKEKNEPVTFTRVFRPNEITSSWSLLQEVKSKRHCEVSFKENESIFDQKVSAQVGFAKKLSSSTSEKSPNLQGTQEEILFLESPEMFVSLVLFEPMLDSEAIVVNNVRRCSQSSGKGLSLEYKGPADQAKTTFILIDALDFNTKESKVTEKSEESIMREINKAYIGIKAAKELYGKTRISTGLWGCGSLGGSNEMKFVIQWVACSLAGVKMVFCSDNETSKELSRLYDVQKTRGIIETLEMLKINNDNVKKKD